MRKNSRFAAGWRHCALPQSERKQNPSESWNISDSKECEHHRKLRQYYQ